jgi:hypothetical protein
MKFEKAFVAFRAFLETLSVAMTAANSTNPVVNFFRCIEQIGKNHVYSSPQKKDEEVHFCHYTMTYTVIIFLAQNGQIRAVKFRPNNFGQFFFDWGEISPNQQILRLSNGRNSSNLEEIRPKFLKANLNCADSPGSPEKISTVYKKFLTSEIISFCK